MTRVAVHGIGQQYLGEETLRAAWLPAFRDGVRRAGEEPPPEHDFVCAFYGDLFRPAGKKAFGDPPYDADSIAEETELALLERWWEEAARIDGMPRDPAEVKARTPRWVQRALNALSGSRFFAGLAERALIFDLKQVASYFRDEQLRAEIRRRVSVTITSDTRVVLAHSLGSVVAYEVLCSIEHSVHTLVTLGSPLGVRNLIFDRLVPAPQNGRGTWPGVSAWTNVSDLHDVVALSKELGPFFGAVQDVRIDNGATAHDVRPYLTAKETGLAAAAGLRS